MWDTRHNIDRNINIPSNFMKAPKVVLGLLKPVDFIVDFSLHLIFG